MTHMAREFRPSPQDIDGRPSPLRHATGISDSDTSKRPTPAQDNGLEVTVPG